LYRLPYILCPISLTLFPLPYTLYHIPYTVYPIPYTLYPVPYTLYPIPHPLSPKPYTVNLRTSTFYPECYALRCSLVNTLRHPTALRHCGEVEVARDEPEPAPAPVESAEMEEQGKQTRRKVRGQGGREASHQDDVQGREGARKEGKEETGSEEDEEE